MATAAVTVAAASSVDSDKKARRLQELFRGRFTEKEALSVILDKNGDLSAAVDFIMKGNPEQIRKFIQDKDQNLVRELQRDVAIINKNLRSGLPCTVRQFGCGPCDNSWWRKVPSRKEVSVCNKCSVKYDPVPRDHEWGWGEFKCPCGNTFGGYGQMGKTGSPCFKCSRQCRPTKINPPSKEGRPRRTTEHVCDAADCYNAPVHIARGGYSRGGGRGRGWGGRGRGGNHRGGHCVHPRSIRQSGGKIVKYASQPHRSTGSTVATFLTQDDLVSFAGSYVSNLEDVREDDEEAQAGSDHDDSDGDPAEDGQ